MPRRKEKPTPREWSAIQKYTLTQNGVNEKDINFLYINMYMNGWKVWWDMMQRIVEKTVNKSDQRVVRITYLAKIGDGNHYIYWLVITVRGTEKERVGRGRGR
jgi:hypothetical protein